MITTTIIVSGIVFGMLGFFAGSLCRGAKRADEKFQAELVSTNVSAPLMPVLIGAASRFNWLAACSGAPFHYLTQAQ